MSPRILFLTIILLFFSLSQVNSQVSIEWQKSFGGSSDECAYSVQQTPDEGYIIVGNSKSSNGDLTINQGKDDVWVLRLTKSAELEWQKSFGGSETEFSTSIQLTKDGGYIFAAVTYSKNGDVSGNHGNTDFWVVKLTSTGDISWQKCLGGSGFDNASSIQQTNDGGFIVAGNTNSINGDITHNHGDYDAWVVKLTNEGKIAWQKCLGGERYDTAYSIQQTSDGGYIVAGSSKSYDGDLTHNNGNNDYWVIKLTAEGDIIWQKSMGGNSGDYAKSIEQTSDGGYIVAGYTKSRNGDVTNHQYVSMNYWVVKLTSDGDISWDKCFGGTGDDGAYSIQQTTDGGYIVVGYTSAPSSYIDKKNDDVSGFNGQMDYWVVKLSKEGNIVWQKCFGGTGIDMAFAVQQTTRGGFVIVGASESTDDDLENKKGKDDLWVVKLIND